MQKPLVGDRELQGKGKLNDFNSIQLPKDDEEILDGETFSAEAQARAIVQALLKEHHNKSEERINDSKQNNELKECLLNLPSLDVMDSPITINQIINHQVRDIPLQQSIMRDPDNYQHQGMQGYEVICKVEPALESD